MCRNIHTLYHTDPPVTEKDINEAALQFVRKVSGYRHPSRANEEAFMAAVQDISATTSRLLAQLETNSPPRKVVHTAIIHNE